MERSERTIVRSFHAMVPGPRNRRARRARAGAGGRARAPGRRLGARRRGSARAGRSLAARAARGEDVGPLAGTRVRVEGLLRRRRPAHDGRRALACARAARSPPARPSCSAWRPPGPISLGKLAMTQLAWGMMGQTPGRPTCRNPHDPERVPGGSSSGSAVAVADGHRRSRAGHRRRRQRAPPGRGLRRGRVQADLRLRPARRLHALRPELRHGRGDRAQRRRGGLAVRGAHGHAARRARGRPRRPAHRVPRRLLHGRALRRRRDDARTHARARARGRDRHRLVAGRQPRDGADLRRQSRAHTCSRTTPIRIPRSTTRPRSPTSSARAAARVRVPAGPRGARRGAAALRCGRCGLRRAAVRLRPVPARFRSTGPTRPRA